MATIMYVKPGCPYCADARADLRARREQFEERDATADPSFRAQLMELTHGTGVVPTLVRDADGSGSPQVQVGFPPGHG